MLLCSYAAIAACSSWGVPWALLPILLTSSVIGQGTEPNLELGRGSFLAAPPCPWPGHSSRDHACPKKHIPWSRGPSTAVTGRRSGWRRDLRKSCLLYTSDAADDLLCVDLGGRRIIK